MTILDISQYDLPTLDAPCFKQAGVTGAILGVYTQYGPGAMRQAAQQLLDADITLHGFYGLIYFGSPTGAYRDTKWAIDLARQFGVGRVWLDCEIDATAIGFTDAVTPTQASRVAEIRECVRLVEAAGLQAGIYSGAWWWPENTGNSTEFAHLPLWHAAYFLDGVKVRSVNYGGWTECAINQWTSSLDICGRKRDANHVWDAAVLEGDEEMTKEEIEALVSAKVNAALSAQFRPLLGLAINGGPGQYADSQGNPLPLVRDEALLAAHKAQAQALTDHILIDHAAGVPGQVPEHRHLGVNRE